MDCDWRIISTPTSIHDYKINDLVFVRSKSAKELGKKGTIVAIHADAQNESKQRKRRREESIKTSHPSSTTSNAMKFARFEIQFETINSQRGMPQIYTKEYRMKRLAPIFHQRPTRSNKNTASFSPQILITRSTESYRLMASSQIQDPHQECVLEIGCSYGKCTQILSKYAKKVVAIDTSLEAIKQAEILIRKQDEFWKKNNVDFRVLDPFMPADARILQEMVAKMTMRKSSSLENLGTNDHAKEKLPAQRKKLYLDCVFIDIGGNRDLLSVIRMIELVQKTFAVSLMVVKSEELEAEAKISMGSTNNYSQCDGENRNIVLKEDKWWNTLLEKTEPKFNSQSMSKQSSTISSKNSNLNTGVLGHQLKFSPKIYTHPLQAPLRYSPRGDGITPICRYHNYHINGCQKGNECPFDHTVCHLCLSGDGHIARFCTYENNK